ncbi:MAG TPA: serine hydrolase domain-containing protein [Luteimonas sp.]|nr:serine hydrolase domain-containing protein [Luteimonas sp.]
MPGGTDGYAPYEAAAAYRFAHGGTAMLVLDGDTISYQRYRSPDIADAPQRLFSISKGFSCLIAAAAVDDGLLAWDEPVSRVLPDWQSRNGRSTITVRDLLSLSSGLDPSRGDASDSDQLARQSVQAALAAAVLAPPGRRFAYGPYPFLAFAKVVQASTGQRADVYLRQRVLDRLGIRVSWLGTSDGHPHLADGALMTPGHLLRLGRFVRDGGRWNGQQVVSREALQECFKPGAAKRTYGMGWWLGGGLDRPEAWSMAARGQFNQGLYIFPQKSRVVVILGDPAAARNRGFDERTFLRTLSRVEELPLN